MREPENPCNEDERLAALHAYEVLDTDPEQAYDDLTRVASEICGTPIALVSLVDSERVWFKSSVGFDEPEVARDVAFCAHAILEPTRMLVVPDSHEDKRFHGNPLTLGSPSTRFYAGAPLVDSDGMALGTMCVVDHEPRELTPGQLDSLSALARQVVCQFELRKRNAALCKLSKDVQRTNEELRQFTSIAAHDLRQPLRKLSALSDLLKSSLGDDLPSGASDDLGSIVESIGHMDRLVSALLKLSRAGSSELVTEPVELSDCAALAADALRSRVDKQDVRIQIDPLPRLEGDMALLTQVFQNLIGNALKFTRKEHPEIRITCVVEDGATVVGVQDDGIGMDPRHAEEIFTPFKRLHSRDEFDGTGIGLSIVRRVIERHGGRIWVESNPGEGSHFRFTLPGVEPSQIDSLAA